MTLYKIAILFVLPGILNCLNVCGDWTQYKDIKCIKVLKQRGTEEEAMSACSQLDSDATLVSIHSQDEQQFLYNMLQDYSEISGFAWLGMKYNVSFKWVDGTTVNYTNWAEDALKDGSEPCVQVSLARATFGKWLDESCKRTGLFICQKRQLFTLNTLRQAVEAMEKKIGHGSVPVGFLYTQLPNQSDPFVLWPGLNWTDVTNEYAGLFFRAEGGGSETFGQIQQANQSWISDRKIIKRTVRYGMLEQTERYYPSSTPGYDQENKVEEQGEWDKIDSFDKVQFDMFYTTKGEVRPKNTAIKIWKRIA